MINKYIKYAIVLSLLVFGINSVLAGVYKTGNPERKRTNKEAPSESFYKKFEKFQEMYADEKYAEARIGLEAMLKKRLNGYELAQVHQFLGWIDSAEEKYDSAVAHLQKAIDADSLQNMTHFAMMYQKVQVLAGAGKYPEAIKALKEYYKVTDVIKDSTYYFEAQIYAQSNKFRPAIKALKKSIKLADKPIESRYYLLFNLHMQLSEYQQAAKALEVLIKLNPNKKDYWVKLNQVYFTLKKDHEALAVLNLADENGLIPEEKDRLQLFKMYAYLGVPYKAAKVLEKGLKTGVIKPSFKRWDDLGKIWYSASEKDNALKAYDEASKLATDGKIDIQRAYIYFDREDWTKAKSALLGAIEKGGLRDKQYGNAWLLLGMVESEIGNSKSAIKSLTKAAKYDNTRKSALQWIAHINKQAEMDRAAAAAERLLAEEREANTIIEQ